ncbi:MAG: hypothetical protein M0Z75_07755 [Nitrospiraceae bacterium]|nr:hypothetical protein [Nitrospiraceae bacterium]MDA8091383.1 hypothetical protein [Nitrospiraceae bacterium]
MKGQHLFLKIAVPAAALAAGLTIGMVSGNLQVKKEKQMFQDRLNDVNRNISSMQKQMMDEEAQAAVSMQQEHQSDMDKLEKLGAEKKALAAQVESLKGRAQKAELQARETDGAFAKTEKDLQGMRQNNKALAQKLNTETGQLRDLQAALKKKGRQLQDFQAELKKTAGGLGHCESNNAELCIIAGGLLKKYRSKGIGDVLLAKEPLTQIRKVEMEHLTAKYSEEIERQKLKKNDGGKK